MQRHLHRVGHGFVGIAEGQALLHQVVGQVGGGGVALERGAFHGLGLHRDAAHHLGHDAQRVGQRVHGVEERLLVFLVVLVVGQRLALHQRQQRHEVADDAAALAARQLGDVGVALLRHDRRARAVAVGEVDEAEVLAHPEHDLLGQPRDMHHADAGAGAEFEREVAVAHRVQAVLANGVETEPARHAFAVQRVAGAGQRSGAQRQVVGAPAHVGQAFGVAREHLHVGQQVVGKTHRLRHLHVRVAGHHGVGVAGGQLDQRALHRGQQQGDAVDLAAEPQAHVGGHLVVAAAAGVQPLAGVADQGRQPGLDVQMHVLELELPFEAAGFDLGRDLRHAALDGGQVRRADHALRGQHLGVREAAFDVGVPQPLVEADAGGVALDEFAHRLVEQGRPGLVLAGQGIVGHGPRAGCGRAERESVLSGAR